MLRAEPRPWRRRELAPIDMAESSVVTDLFLSYRTVEAWEDMIALVELVSEPLAQTTIVQEQLVLALNRCDRDAQAERNPTALIARRGPSSETYGILGRVLKDRYAAARKGDLFLASGFLTQAIDAYVKGFETIRGTPSLASTRSR